MGKDYGTDPITKVRRTDREVTDEKWIRMFLQRAPIGTLATIRDGQPFINSNLFVYDENENVIYLHTAHVGRTRSNVELNGRVCFNASVMGRLLPAAEALEFSVEYAGVTVFGNAKIVSEESEKVTALQHLLDKYFHHLSPGEDYRCQGHLGGGRQKSILQCQGDDGRAGIIRCWRREPCGARGNCRADRRRVPQASSGGAQRRGDRGYLADGLRRAVLAAGCRRFQRDGGHRRCALGHHGQARRNAGVPAPRRQGAPGLPYVRQCIWVVP